MAFFAPILGWDRPQPFFRLEGRGGREREHEIIVPHHLERVFFIRIITIFEFVDNKIYTQGIKSTSTTKIKSLQIYNYRFCYMGE